MEDPRKKILNGIINRTVIYNIFSFLNEKQKLNLILHNKKLQKILGVDINNYKRVSGRYIISKNERTEEYYDNSKKFKFREPTKFINKNGQGVEYDEEGNLVFEGQYLEGKRSGKGKQYNKLERVIFDGEFLYGEKLKWKEYTDKGVLVYEGEYLNDKRKKGREYNEKGKKL